MAVSTAGLLITALPSLAVWRRAAILTEHSHQLDHAVARTGDPAEARRGIGHQVTVDAGSSCHPVTASRGEAVDGQPMRFSIAFVVDSRRSSFFGRRRASSAGGAASRRSSRRAFFSRDDAAPGCLSRRRRTRFFSIVCVRALAVAHRVCRSQRLPLRRLHVVSKLITTLRVLCASQCCTIARSPNTLRTAFASAFQPSMTTSTARSVC